MSLLAQVQFVGGVIVRSLIQQPDVLFLSLVVVCTTIATFWFLSKQSFISPARLVLPLLVVLLGIIIQTCSLQAELVATGSILQEKSWALQQSKNFRNRILQQLSTTDNTITNTRPEESTNPLDGCTHVFIDLSSNNRPQIRKLIEPQLFPGDPILPVYQRYFGPPEKRSPGNVCVVRFQQDNVDNVDNLEDPLKALVDAYSTCGIKVFIENDLQVTNYIKDVAATRSNLSEGTSNSSTRIVVGCDVDICTAEMLSDLALSGVLGLVDNIHIFGTALQYSSGRNSKLTKTLVPALTSLGQLTRRLNMEEQFSVDLVSSPEYPKILPPPEC